MLSQRKSLDTPRCNLQMPWLKNWRCRCLDVFPTRKIYEKFEGQHPIVVSTWQDWSRVAAPELEKLTDAGRMVSLEKC